MNKVNQSNDERVESLKNKIKQVEKKPEYLEKRFIEREIIKDLFEKYTIKYKAKNMSIEPCE